MPRAQSAIVKAERIVRWLAPFLVIAALFGQTTAREWSDKGLQALRSQQYHEAVAAFRQAADLDPGSTDYRMYLASAYFQQYVPGSAKQQNIAIARQAAAEFQRVVDMDAGNLVAVLSLGNLYLNLKQWDDAVRWYQRALDIDPQKPETYYTLAFIDWSRWYPAYQAARQRLHMAPKQPGPLSDPTRTELKNQWQPTIEDGIDNLNKALSINPQYGDAMAYMNLFMREQADLADSPEECRRETAEANEWFRKAIEAKKREPKPAAGTRPATVPTGPNGN
jgi:tetratricopeptide (TPR) repeat protein